MFVALIRLTATALAAVGLVSGGKGLDLSTDGRGHELMAYVLFYGLAGLLFAVAFVFFLAAHQKTRDSVNVASIKTWGDAPYDKPHERGDWVALLIDWNGRYHLCLQRAMNKKSRDKNYERGLQCFDQMRDEITMLMAHGEAKGWVHKPEWGPYFRVPPSTPEGLERIKEVTRAIREGNPVPFDPDEAREGRL